MPTTADAPAPAAPAPAAPGRHLVGDGAQGHPLAALAPAEVEAAADLLQRTGVLGGTVRISYLGLEEPPKQEVLSWAPGRELPRLVRALLVDTASGACEDVVADLRGGTLVRRDDVDPVAAGQVPLLPEEHALVRELVAADPRWVAALAARGITDPSTVCLAALSAGRYDEVFAGESGRRLARVLAHHQPTPDALPWAHPVDGLVAHVDLRERCVTEVVDTGVLPIPAESGDYHVPGAFGPERTTQRPLLVTQPEGPSPWFSDGLLHWEKWSLRVGYDMREGLVLHQLGFDDGGGTRSVVYRASVAEMVVPYGDPSPIRFWQNYFDTGEYQLGRLVNSLELGCDCLGEITYLDVTVPQADGSVRVLPNAVCIHEEDTGVLWKHTEEFTRSSEVRRGRRLVISSFVTVGNYDYGFYWYLYLDGTIELEVKATGIVFTAVYDERASAYASEVAPGLAAPYHQHLFCARLDMAVDGVRNVVDEIDVVPVPLGPQNPHGNAIGRRATRLRTEADAQRDADDRADRTWRIASTERTNRLGQPTSYVLVPEGGPTLAAHPDSVIARRAAFAGHHLWVTRYDPAERYPAGDIVNQSAPGAGLPAFVADPQSVDGEDVVLWHTFGLTHFPRTEDWPIMPVDSCGFALKPSGFFDRNPTLDVPRPAAAHGSPACCEHP
ncbi:primary-amine oxidase [Kineococcus arenarius]|uniref:primary-amine oxidase n=1 Tax=unclassified Kineococcus TaxID=2621656 RepID=UPI003D7EB98A